MTGRFSGAVYLNLIEAPAEPARRAGRVHMSDPTASSLTGTAGVGDDGAG
ncbi:hypothetical protein [Streptomyces sp. 147326]